MDYQGVYERLKRELERLKASLVILLDKEEKITEEYRTIKENLFIKEYQLEK